MINIKPISELKTNLADIEEVVLQRSEEIYLTKNGYGAMVLVKLEKYADLLDEIKSNDRILYERFTTFDVNKQREDTLTGETTAESTITKARKISSVNKI